MAGNKEMGQGSRLGLELLAEIETMTDAIIRENPDNPGKALAEHLRLHYGGQQLYFPMGKARDISRRNAAIYDAFTGDNQAELAARFHLAFTTIYDIIRSERERRRVKQGSLLDVG